MVKEGNAGVVDSFVERDPICVSGKVEESSQAHGMDARTARYLGTWPDFWGRRGMGQAQASGS